LPPVGLGYQGDKYTILRVEPWEEGSTSEREIEGRRERDERGDEEYNTGSGWSQPSRGGSVRGQLPSSSKRDAREGGLGVVTWQALTGDRRLWGNPNRTALNGLLTPTPMQHTPGDRDHDLDLDGLLAYLREQERRGYVLVTWGGTRTDFRLLADAWLSQQQRKPLDGGIGRELVSLALGHVDLQSVYATAMAGGGEPTEGNPTEAAPDLVDVARAMATAHAHRERRQQQHHHLASSGSSPSRPMSMGRVLLSLWEGSGLSHGASVVGTVWRGLMEEREIRWLNAEAEGEVWRLPEEGMPPAWRGLRFPGDIEAVAEWVNTVLDV